MDYSGALRREEPEAAEFDMRSAPRFASLIRSAKLVTDRGEFICVIRDVSATGVSLRSFHALPGDTNAELELRNGERYGLEWVREHGHEVSYRFAERIDVERLISESWNFPKRQLRVSLAVPMVVATLGGRFFATTENLSQQGARITCDALLAIDQCLRIEAAALPEIRAKVRWRRGTTYGLVFDDTFALREFALLAAAVQAPSLLPVN